MSVMYSVTLRPKRLTSGPNGMTAYAMSAGTIEMMGAAVKTHLSARAGVMSSLIISFTASAFFCSSRRRHTSSLCDWSSDVCSSDLGTLKLAHSGKAYDGGLQGLNE